MVSLIVVLHLLQCLWNSVAEHKAAGSIPGHNGHIAMEVECKNTLCMLTLGHVWCHCAAGCFSPMLNYLIITDKLAFISLQALVMQQYVVVNAVSLQLDHTCICHPFILAQAVHNCIKQCSMTSIQEHQKQMLCTVTFPSM